MPNDLVLRWCQYDHCCEFKPESHNHIYCTEHGCKRRAENSRKRLTDPLVAGEDIWKLQERRKIGRLELAQAKNDWLLSTSKIGSFDLETFDLSADFGLVMVGCLKTRGDSNIFTTVAHGDTDELAGLLAMRDAVESMDYIVTYYGTKFDIPFFNTRLLIHGERPINRIRHIDLYYVVKRVMRMQRNRLSNVEMALFNKGDKTAILPGIWRRALQGSQEDLDYIVDHCQKDVLILEEAFERLRGFINLSATRWRKFGGSY
jgi:uncharacterized protein YprB with RNaseH-like and TPR domain